MRRWGPSTPKALVLLAALVAASAPARAQPPEDPVVTLTASPIAELLFPETENARTQITLRFSCSVPELTSVQPIIAVFHTAEKPETITTVLTPMQASQDPVSPAQCTDNAVRHVMHANATIQASRATPALEPIALEFAANFTIRPAAGDPKQYGAFGVVVPLEVDFLPFFNFVPEDHIVTVNRGESARLNVTLRSFANGASYIETTGTATHGATLELPPRTQLASPLRDGEGAQKTVVVTVVPAPGFAGFINVNLTFTQRSEDARGTRTETVSGLSSVHVRGIGDSPAPLTPVAILGLCMALALGRRRT